jgi:glycosyltransferase involved in cell wall biosynthesis
VSGRICVLFRTTPGPWGGGNSFLRSLTAAWRSSGIHVLDAPDADADAILINSSYRGALKRLLPAETQRLAERGYLSRWAETLGLSRWRRRGSRPPIVHRLDGVFRLYGRPAEDPADVDQLVINRHADWTVYQSEFCRRSFALEGADVSRSSVILNGVDLAAFTPAAEPPPPRPLKLIAAAWSSNLRKGAPDIARISELPDVEVTFVGNWPGTVDSARVRLLPPQSHAELPALLRRHHAFVHMAQNEPCSNAVLEGIASGLPVLFHPSGGNSEIVGDAGIACTERIEHDVTELRDRYADLRERALERRSLVGIERAARAYLAAIESLPRMPCNG